MSQVPGSGGQEQLALPCRAAFHRLRHRARLPWSLFTGQRSEGGGEEGWDPASAGGLDWVTHRGPRQPRPCWDSVTLWSAGLAASPSAGGRDGGGKLSQGLHNHGTGSGAHAGSPVRPRAPRLGPGCAWGSASPGAATGAGSRSLALPLVAGGQRRRLPARTSSS